MVIYYLKSILLNSKINQIFILNLEKSPKFQGEGAATRIMVNMFTLPDQASIFVFITTPSILELITSNAYCKENMKMDDKNI